MLLLSLGYIFFDLSSLLSSSHKPLLFTMGEETSCVVQAGVVENSGTKAPTPMVVGPDLYLTNTNDPIST